MPAAGAHYQFGQLALERSGLASAHCLTAHKDMFDLGTQGPDILFFYRPYSKNMVSCLGGSFHRDSGAALFLPLFEHRNSWSAPLTAYLLGVCCHYALDCICHPLINQLAPQSIQHKRIESALDRLIFDQYAISIPRQQMLPKRADLPVLQQVYPQLSAAILKECVRSVRGYNQLLEHAKWVAILEKCIGGSGTFSSMCVPPLVEEEDCARQLLPLFHDAIPYAVLLMTLVESKTTSEALLHREMSKNFEGVLP